MANKRVTLRHASTHRCRRHRHCGDSPSPPVQTPPISIPSCVHGVNCVTSPPVCTAGPHFALANNDHQGRGEYNELDKSSTMMMDCVAIEARGLKQALRDPRYWKDSTWPAGATALFRLPFSSSAFPGDDIFHTRPRDGGQNIKSDIKFASLCYISEICEYLYVAEIYNFQKILQIKLFSTWK